MKRNPLVYTYNVIGMAILIFLLGRTYLPYIEIYLNKNNETYIIAITYALMLAVCCAVPTLFMKKMLSMDINVFKAKKQKKFLLYVICGQAVFIEISFVFNIIYVWLSNNFGLVIPDTKLLPIDNVFTFIVYYIYIAVTPAIFEEIFVRGYILNSLIPHGKVLALVVSSIIFSIMHQDLLSVPPIFISSIILGVLYMITDNIYVSMAVHCFNNSFSFIMMYVEEYMNTYQNIVIIIAFNLVILIIGLITNIIFRYRNKDQEFLEECDVDGFGKGILKMFKSPILIVSLIICLIVSVEGFINA